MQKTDTSIQSYIQSLPAESQADIAKLDAEITKLFEKNVKGKGNSNEEKVMWEGKFWGGSDQRIIGYGTQIFVGSSKKPVEWFTVGLAQQKNYITVFIVGVKDGKYLLDSYAKQFGRAKVGKSTVSFQKLADIDLAKLLQVIAEAFDSAPQA